MPQGLFATYATKHDIKLKWSHLLQEEVARAYNTDGGFRSITNSIIMRSAFNKLREACDPFLELGTLRGRTFSFDYSEGQVAMLNHLAIMAEPHLQAIMLHLQSKAMEEHSSVLSGCITPLRCFLVTS